MKTVKQESGVGLIEVLLAVVMLSLGFLAAAKMQIAGMRYSQNAYFLSQANFMVRDMTDRMRANTSGVIAGHYKNVSTASGTAEQACITNGTQCNPQQLASADLHAWSINLHAPADAVDFKPILPSMVGIPAKGEITYNELTDVYTIRVVWGEMYEGDPEEQELSVQLTP